MTSQGSVDRRFTRRAIQRNLFAAEMAMREMGTPSLLVAIDYLLLVAEEPPAKYLYDYPPGAYRNSILREWRVLLINPTRGRHLIRYVTHERGSVTDVTFTVWIR